MGRGRAWQPGPYIALADESGVIWTKGFGYANREQRTPFTANARSNIASVSKQFTCAAVTKLMEEDRLKELTSGNTPPEDYPDTFLKLPAALVDEYAAAPPDTEARIMGVGRNLGETIRIVSGREGEKLLFQGYVLSRR